MNRPVRPDAPGATEGPGWLLLAPGVALSADLVRVSFVASAGPGGQNVNKRATKCELRVALRDLPMDPGALGRLRRAAGRRLTAEGELVLTCDEQRTQARNRSACLERLRELVAGALVPPTPRRPTKPTRGSVERRLDAKKREGARKSGRRAGRDRDE